MKPKRPFGTARRLLAAPLVVLMAALGLAAGAVPAKAGLPPFHLNGCIIWQTITLENGWISDNSAYDTGNPSFCENDGMVYLSGSLAVNSAIYGDESFGTLPSGYRPSQNIYLSVYTLGGVYGVLQIDANGTMFAYDGSATGYTSLAGVSFPAASFSMEPLSLENGWLPAFNGTGDPSYGIDSNDIVHMTGSIYDANGTPPTPPSYLWNSVILPSGTLSADDCADFNVYGFESDSTLGPPSFLDEVENPGEDDPASLSGGNPGFTSLAGISYPAVPEADWQALYLMNGAEPVTGGIVPDFSCSMAPSVYSVGDVVYLTGLVDLPAGFDGEIALLPESDGLPAHNLYMIASTGQNSTTSGDNYMVVEITPAGGVWIWNAPGNSNDDVELSGLSFVIGS
jgi:hypothetical protein